VSKPIETARQLRKSVTAAEESAWWLLRNRRLMGLKFRRQHPIGKYTVDFFCFQAQLAVELDGSVHAKPSQARKDATKEAYLKRMGIRVLRVPNGMVLEDPELFCRKVRGAGTESLFSKGR
jgi:very-short-patch-repair endonuclease